MAAHTDPAAIFTLTVQPDQPPSGRDAWLREMARAVNQIGARTTELATAPGTPGPPGPTGPAGPAGPTGPSGTSGPWTAGAIPFADTTSSLGQDPTQLFWDNTNNRLGVGTATPVGNLHVGGADSFTLGVVAGATKAVRFGASSAGSTIEGTDNTGTASYQPLQVGASILTLATGGSERMRVDAAGTVQMGTTVSGGRLTLVGAAAPGSAVSTFGGGPNGADSTTYIINIADFALSVGIGGIARTGTNSVQYLTTSDARLKTDVTPSDLGLDALMRIEVADYRMGDDTPRQGVLAQQLHEVYPEAVHVGGDNPMDPWGVDYGRLTPLLIRTIQQQQAHIERLEVRLAHLERPGRGRAR